MRQDNAVALSLGDRMAEDMARLRYQPTPKRVRLDLWGCAGRGHDRRGPGVGADADRALLPRA